MQIVDSLRNGNFPSPAELFEALERLFPLMSELSAVPQDPIWHAEGDVRIHTEMVIAEMIATIRSGDEALAVDEQVGLIIGAALHDIGKALTTREEEIKGKLRIVAPNHADRGRSYVTPLIEYLDLTDRERQVALAVIRFHHEPKKLVFKSSGEHRYRQLARASDLRLLYLFERCDMKGRESDDLASNLETLELFRLESESFGLWQNSDPYQSWRQFFDQEIADTKERDYALREAIRSYELGQINSPEEALAKTWQHRKEFGTVTLLSAPAGSGKSTWARENIPSDDPVILSLDQIREELTGKRSDQSKNGQVLQLAKERLRQQLRQKRDVIWDTTGLRRDGRAMVTGLAHDYHCASRIVALAVSPQTASRQNKQRQSSIPTAALEKQFRQWQWPDIWEAHWVEEVF